MSDASKKPKKPKKPAAIKKAKALPAVRPLTRVGSPFILGTNKPE
jgi:hypothetical protein